MTHVACRLTAKNRDQLRNHTLGNRVWATFTFLNSIPVAIKDDTDKTVNCDEKLWSTARPLALVLSAACSMPAVRRQRKPCRRRFVDVSAARRGRQTTKHAVQIEPVHSGVVSGTTVRALVLGRFSHHAPAGTSATDVSS